MTVFEESVAEQAALGWLESTGGAVRNGDQIATAELAAERTEHHQVVLQLRLHDALARFIPALLAEAIQDTPP